MSDQMSLGASTAPTLPHLSVSNEASTIEEMRAMALAYARAFSHDYNDQQDLTSQAILAVLQYRKPILYPKQFLRTTIRNLAVSRARSRVRCSQELAFDSIFESENSAALCPNLILSDTLSRLESELTPSELRSYRLLCQGFEQRDLPRLLNVSRQAVSQTILSIRRKYLDVEAEENRSASSSRKHESKGVGDVSQSVLQIGFTR